MPAQCPYCGWRTSLKGTEPEDGSLLTCPNCKIELRYHTKTKPILTVAVIIVSFSAIATLSGDWLSATSQLVLIVIVVLLCISAFMTQKLVKIDSDTEAEDRG